MAGFVFGVIGIYWIKRAKREAHLPSLVFGIALMAYPYFIENAYWLWGIGVGLCFLAYKMVDV